MATLHERLTELCRKAELLAVKVGEQPSLSFRQVLANEVLGERAKDIVALCAQRKHDDVFVIMHKMHEIATSRMGSDSIWVRWSQAALALEAKALARKPTLPPKISKPEVVKPAPAPAPRTYTRNCRRCKLRFVTSAALQWACSDACRKAPKRPSRTGRYKPRPAEPMKCKQCHKTFMTTRLDQRYCNAKCRLRHQAAHVKPQRRAPGGWVKLEKQACVICSNEYQPRQRRQMICSGACRRVYLSQCYHGREQAEKICLACQKPFKTANQSKLTCSEDCRAIARKARLTQNLVSQERVCNVCQVTFTPAYTWQRTCRDDNCILEHRAQAQRERHRRAAARRYEASRKRDS
jgi:hypothetical protein